MGQCSTSIKAYDFKKISSEISNIKRRVCYLEAGGAGAIIANNGLTLTNDLIQLGGNLIQNTYIGLSSDFEFGVRGSEGDNVLLFDEVNGVYFFGIDTAGDRQLVTGWNWDSTNIIEGRVDQKVAIKAAETISGLVVTMGDVDDIGDGTKIIIDDSAEMIKIINIQEGASTDQVLLIDSDDIIKKIDFPVESGNYTPTITGLANITSITAAEMQYLRVGDVVTVSGKITIEATAANVDTIATITNPINNQNFSNPQECGGSAVQSSGSGRNVAAVYAIGATKNCGIYLYPVNTNNNEYAIHWTYKIIRTAP